MVIVISHGIAFALAVATTSSYFLHHHPHFRTGSKQTEVVCEGISIVRITGLTHHPRKPTKRTAPLPVFLTAAISISPIPFRVETPRGASSELSSALWIALITDSTPAAFSWVCHSFALN